MDRTRSLVDMLGCLFFINYFFVILFFCVLTHAHTYTTNYNLLGPKFPFIKIKEFVLMRTIHLWYIISNSHRPTIAIFYDYYTFFHLLI